MPGCDRAAKHPQYLQHSTTTPLGELSVLDEVINLSAGLVVPPTFPPLRCGCRCLPARRGGGVSPSLSAEPCSGIGRRLESNFISTKHEQQT
ncbi:hypothetical protein PoB_005873100 [Plakobranchus ocellatus]|uniref:Uncharacterized protein n=1 Tax=Plakobranchus ocellatus TaxID=259542 RepID=A0AAV4CHC6_9GAST|nr:hypothetical protein PoB_005873100 [Plakobranchus ocellatus]